MNAAAQSEISVLGDIAVSRYVTPYLRFGWRHADYTALNGGRLHGLWVGNEAAMVHFNVLCRHSPRRV